jgi:hypothetical protein
VKPLLIRVTGETQSYGVSANCAHRTEDRVQIEMIEKVPLIKPVFDWGGWGIRKQLQSLDTMGYVPKKGPGLHITLLLEDGKKKSDTFLCVDPDGAASPSRRLQNRMPVCQKGLGIGDHSWG